MAQRGRAATLRRMSRNCCGQARRFAVGGVRAATVSGEISLVLAICGPVQRLHMTNGKRRPMRQQRVLTAPTALRSHVVPSATSSRPRRKTH